MEILVIPLFGRLLSITRSQPTAVAVVVPHRTVSMFSDGLFYLDSSIGPAGISAVALALSPDWLSILYTKNMPRLPDQR